MREINPINLRKALEQMTTQQLDAMLRVALHKEPVDGDIVRLILIVLQDREKEPPGGAGPGLEAAGQTCLERPGSASQKKRKWGTTLEAASIVAVLAARIVLSSQEVRAKKFLTGCSHRHRTCLC